MAKTTTFYIKCADQEAESIRSAAKEQQRTVHNWLRYVVLQKIKLQIAQDIGEEKEFGICPECGADGKKSGIPMAHRSGSGRLMPGHREV